MNSYLPVSLFTVFFFVGFFLLPSLLFLHCQHNLHNDNQQQHTAQYGVVPWNRCKYRDDYRAHRSDECEYFLKNTGSCFFCRISEIRCSSARGLFCRCLWVHCVTVPGLQCPGWIRCLPDTGCMYSCGRGFRLPGCRWFL